MADNLMSGLGDCRHSGVENRGPASCYDASGMWPTKILGHYDTSQKGKRKTKKGKNKKVVLS